MHNTLLQLWRDYQSLREAFESSDTKVKVALPLGADPLDLRVTPSRTVVPRPITKGTLEIVPAGVVFDAERDTGLIVRPLTETPWTRMVGLDAA